MTNEDEIDQDRKYYVAIANHSSTCKLINVERRSRKTNQQASHWYRKLPTANKNIFFARISANYNTDRHIVSNSDSDEACWSHGQRVRSKRCGTFEKARMAQFQRWLDQTHGVGLGPEELGLDDDDEHEYRRRFGAH